MHEGHRDRSGEKDSCITRMLSGGSSIESVDSGRGRHRAQLVNICGDNGALK